MDEKEAVKKYGHLVKKAAKKYYPKFKQNDEIQIDDLMGMGYVGLLEAARRYNNQDSFNRFTAFAYYRIRGNILDGTDQFLDIKKRKKYKINIINLDNDQIEKLVYEKSEVVNEVVNEIYKKELLKIVNCAINEYLTPKEKEAITLKYKHKMKSEDISKQMGISVSRVSRLCLNGIKRIKKKLNLEEISFSKKKIGNMKPKEIKQNIVDEDIVQVS